MNLKYTNALWLAVVISMSSVGCNSLQAVNSNGSGNSASSVDQNVDTNVDMTALNKSLDDLDASLAEVDAQVNKLDLSQLQSGSSATTTQQGLDKSLRKILDKLVGAVSKAISSSSDLRIQLVNRIAKLDPANPLHALAIEKLNQALAYLDQLDQRLKDEVYSLAAKFDSTVANLDAKVAALDQKNPLNWAVAIYWQQVRAVILEYKDKLITLAP